MNKIQTFLFRPKKGGCFVLVFSADGLLRSTFVPGVIRQLADRLMMIDLYRVKPLIGEAIRQFDTKIKSFPKRRMKTPNI
jgi:hypothetical protein